MDLVVIPSTRALNVNPSSPNIAKSVVDFPNREECLRLIAPLPLLAVEPAVLEVVQTYIARRVMPRNPVGDALHLALASHHRCDFLATWNCKHLANANKFAHIRRVNTLLGLFVPSLVTPLELLEVDDED